MTIPSLGSISRSAIETFHECPRKRLLAYEWLRGLPLLETGEIHHGGLSPAGQSIFQLTGTAVHAGFAHLLKTCQEWEQVGKLLPWGQMRTSAGWLAIVRTAAALAREEFNVGAEGVALGLDPGAEGPHQEFYKQEQRALVEGLVWVAGLRLVPELVGRYRILEVEREERMQLAEGLRPFAARADALLEDRSSGELSVFSLKTAAVWGKQEEMRFRRDVQGLSEAVAIEHRLQRTYQRGGPVEPAMEIPFHESGRVKSWEEMGEPLPVRVETIQMAMLLKGIRRASESRGGRKEHYSPLTRAYRLVDPLSGIEQWAWSFDVKRQDKTGLEYTGKLGKGWSYAPAWEYPGGTEAWVLALDQEKIQPEQGDALAGCLALPEPWARSEDELNDWLEQTRTQEKLVDDGLEEVNDALVEGRVAELRHAMNTFFPQRRSSCVAFNSSCAYDALCWGGQGLTQLASGAIPEGFVPRRDHHGEVEE